MKARDIETELQNKLPLLTNRFTDEQTLLSIVPAGTTATATTATAHNLTVSQKVLIAGANAAVDIDTIDRVTTVATAVTVQNHDLTEGFFDNVTLSGATEAEFNGTFTLLSVPNRKTFTFTVADSGPTSATGSPILEEPGLPFGYNGLITITAVPTTKTFTYTLPQTLVVNAAGANMRVIKNVRIHAAINSERADKVFESRDINNLADGELTLVVVLNEMTASRDRSSLADGVSSAAKSGDNRQQILQTVSCFVYQKVTKDSSGANAADSMQDIARFIIRVLSGFGPDNGFSSGSQYQLRFLTHGVSGYDSAIYSQCRLM